MGKPIAWGRCASVLLLIAPLAHGASFRYVSANNCIYIENGGGASLSAIKLALPAAPLDLVDAANKIWLLRADLLIEDGSVLRLHGAGVGGDVNELRLKSDNAPAPGSFVSITADHGRIDIRATKLISWDTAAGAPDAEYGMYGRAYIRVRSKLVHGGKLPLESRMDIVDSEVAYLGHGAAEAYGLVWKVNGSESYIFDRVRVRGNIINSGIHHNYTGAYSYGAWSGVWRNNEIHSNALYGLEPSTRSDYLIIENNNVHHNGNHGIMVAKRCEHVVIRNNRAWANGGNGITLHRASNYALVEGNQAYRNADSGIGLFASSRSTVRNNVVLANAHAGIRLAAGASDNTIQGNEIGYSGHYGLLLDRSNDKPEPGDDGRPKRNTFANNRIYGSGAEGLKVVEGLRNRFIDNLFHANAAMAHLAAAAQTELVGNSFHSEAGAP